MRLRYGVGLICLGAGNLYAALYGLVEGTYNTFSYETTTPSGDTRSNGETSIIQNYQLGYRGSVYSPKLLQYDLFGSFLLRDVSSHTNGVEMQTEQEGNAYRINLHGIQESKFPISAQLEKTYSPMATVTASGDALIMSSESETRGVSGSIRLDETTLSYFYNERDSFTDQLQSEETFINDFYGFSVARTFNNNSFTLSYTEGDYGYERIEKTGLYPNDGWMDHKRDIALNDKWDVSRDLSIDSSLTYNSSSYLNLETRGASMAAAWKTSDVHSVYGGINYSQMNSGEGEGLSEIDMLAMNLNSIYQLTPYLSFSNTLNFNSIQSNNNEMIAYSIASGVSHTMVLSENVRWSNSLRLSGASYDTTSSYAGHETYQIYNGNANTNYSVHFPSIGGQFFVSGSYMQMESTRSGEDNGGYGVQMGMTLQPFESFVFRSVGGYNEQYYSVLENGQLESIRTRTVETFDNSVRYTSRIGFSGILNMDAGVLYSKTSATDSETYVNLYPHGDVSLMIPFDWGLQMNMQAAVSQDRASDVMNYSANIGLNYRLRRVLMALTARYGMQESATVGNTVMNSIMYKISRPF